MIDGPTILNAIDDLEREKNIDRQLIINAIKEGIIKAYEKYVDSEAKIEVVFNEVTGDIKVYRLLSIVDEVISPSLEISSELLKDNKNAIVVDDVYKEPVNIENFSRLATAQVAQIFVQCLKEAEREVLYQKYISKKDEILVGTVDNIETGRYLLKISDNTFATLLKRDVIPLEKLRLGSQIKFYVEDVKKNTGQIMASRIHPRFLERLLEIEVPEIYEGVIEIKAVSRIPGERSKVAVFCKDSTIDPIGACVGNKGQRIQSIMTELNGEKIDIIRWNEDPQTFIINALSPAKAISIQLNEETNEANIIVPDEQYSLAIGKKGMTARLTAKLTKWKINIISFTKAQEQREEIIWNGNLNPEELTKLQNKHQMKKEKGFDAIKEDDDNFSHKKSINNNSNFSMLSEEIEEENFDDDDNFDNEDIDDYDDEY